MVSVRGSACFISAVLILVQTGVLLESGALEEAGSDIYITSESGLSSSSFVRSGSGTQLSPYVISDWNMSDHYIRIENTQSNLIIRNITFSSDSSWALYLNNADNIVIKNVTSTGRGRFLYSGSCDDIRVEECNVTSIPDQTNVVEVWSGTGITITKSRFVNASHASANIFFDNYGNNQRFTTNYLEGIPLEDSLFGNDGYIFNCTFKDSPVTLGRGQGGAKISSCIFNSPGENALSLSNCNYMDIKDNWFHGTNGIYFAAAQYLTGSTYGNINNNTFESCDHGILSTQNPFNVYTSLWQLYDNYFGNCSTYAIDWGRGGSNKIWRNIFYHNAGTDNLTAGSQCKQFNYGSYYKNDWTVGSSGNFWANHRTPDADKNGIVDNPYTINAGGTDTIPFTNPYFDTETPTVEITSPTDLYPDRSYITVHWDAADIGSGIEKIEMKVDSGPWVDVTGTSFRSIFLKEGNHFVEVKVTDRAGLTNLSRRQYILQKTVEVIDLISPQDGEYIPRTEVDIEWSLADYFDTVNQTILIDGEISYLNPLQRVFRPQLDEGYHGVEIRCRDEGGLTVKRSANFTIDLTDPDVEIISPQEGSFLSNTYISIKFNVTDNLGLKNLQTRLNDEDWVDQNLESRSLQTLLDEGNHTVSVRGIDNSGRSKTRQVSFKIGENPLLRFISPEDGTFTNKDTINLTWEYSGPFMWETALMRVGIAAEFEDIQGETELSVELEDDDEYEIRLRLQDSFQNYIETSIVVIKDTTPPNVGFIWPKDGDHLGNQLVPLAWKGTDNYGYPIQRYELRIDQGSWMDMGLDEMSNMTLFEGAHDVSVRAYDMAGNVRQNSISFRIDITEPDVEFITPDNGTILTDSLMTFIYAAEDSGGLVRLDLSIDGKINISVLGTNQRTTTIGTDGAHTVRLTAVDRAGNIAYDEIVLIVDLVEPFIQWVVEPSGYTNTSSYTFSWNITEEIGLASLYVTLDGSIVDLDTDDSETTLDLEEGEHVIVLTAIDLAGWRSELTPEETLIVDLASPIVQLDEFNSKVEGNSAKVLWSNADEGSGIGNAMISLDGGDFEPVLSENMNEYTFEGLSIGDHTATIRVFDKAGNFREVQWDFTVQIEGEQEPEDEEETDPLTIILAALGAFILILLFIVIVVMRRKRKEEEKRKEARRKRLQKPDKVNLGLSTSKTSRPLPSEAKPVRDLPPTSRPEKVEETGIGEGYIRPKKEKKGKKPKRVIEKKEEEEIPSFMAGAGEEIPDFGVDKPRREPEPEHEMEKPIFERPQPDRRPPEPPREEEVEKIPEPVWDEDEEEPEEEEEDLHHDENRDYGFSHDEVVWSEKGPSSIDKMEDDEDIAEEMEEEEFEEMEELEEIEEFEDMDELEDEDETREAIFDDDSDDEELEEWG